MKKAFFLLSIIFSLISCEGDDSACCGPSYQINCDKSINVDELKFNQVNTTNYMITAVTLVDNCLNVTINSSGCDPDNWEMNLIASSYLTETLPMKYAAKVELINNDDCLAFYEKSLSFDLAPLQVQNQNQVQINIEGWESDILYTY